MKKAFDSSKVAEENRKLLDRSIVTLEVVPSMLFGKPVQTLKVSQLQELKRNRKACKFTSKLRRNKSKPRR